MKFCPDCGGPVQLRIPPGDNRPRAVCQACGAIHYQNPRIVVGCVPERHGRILLCQRAIDPRRGYWTFPAGFYEIGETLAQAAARESLEEALARVQIGSLLAITHLLHAAQVHMTFRATLLDEDFGVGAESLQVGLYEEREIPWDQLAFPSIHFALRCYFADRSAGVEQLHVSTAERMPAGSAAAQTSSAL
ncbi:MAG TPA: NUDIX hydrolase [Steroidobacteraceae bacterium]|nr:NUDIX hydrolase [Steroidobacteraceae bacterium]